MNDQASGLWYNTSLTNPRDGTRTVGRWERTTDMTWSDSTGPQAGYNSRSSCNRPDGPLRTGFRTDICHHPTVTGGLPTVHAIRVNSTSEAGPHFVSQAVLTRFRTVWLAAATRFSTRSALSVIHLLGRPASSSQKGFAFHRRLCLPQA
jgi:hypothetical protein